MAATTGSEQTGSGLRSSQCHTVGCWHWAMLLLHLSNRHQEHSGCLELPQLAMGEGFPHTHCSGSVPARSDGAAAVLTGLLFCVPTMCPSLCRLTSPISALSSLSCSPSHTAYTGLLFNPSIPNIFAGLNTKTTYPT